MTIQAGGVISVVTFGTFYPGVGAVVPLDSLDDSPAILVRQFIVEQLELTLPAADAAWPCYIGSMPDGDAIEDDCGCIYDTEGLKDGRLMIGPVVQHYGIQLKIRSKEYADGWKKIDDIAAKLDVLINWDVTYNGTDYRVFNVSRATPIAPIGNEPSTKRRYLFTGNFLATISQVL